MSIVESLLEAVQRETKPHAGLRVLAVHVRIGRLRLVVPDTLRFCYTAATAATPLAGSRLEIAEVPAMARCGDCHADFPVEDDWFECPHCQTTSAELVTGRELDLLSIDLDEPVG